MPSNGFAYGPVSYYSPGRCYLRQRLRENPWPVRNRNWLDTLFPPVTGRPSITFLTGYWVSGYEILGEWGYNVPSATSQQALNSAITPVLVRQALRARLLPVVSANPGQNLSAYVGKRNTNPPLLTTTPTRDGQDILVDLAASDLYALISAYGPGEIYVEVWEDGYPSPLATFTFFLDRSMAGGV